MVSRPITNTENIIHSKDLFMRINWLQQQLNYRCSDEYSEELKALNTLARNIEAVASVSTYGSGTDLILDSYIEEYTKALEGSDTANAARMAFTPVNFNGTSYWLSQPTTI